MTKKKFDDLGWKVHTYQNEFYRGHTRVTDKELTDN